MIEKISWPSKPAYPTAALAGRHRQADFAQTARPARLAVVQAAIAQQLAALFGEHRDIAPVLQVAHPVIETFWRGHVYQEEEEVVFRLRAHKGQERLAIPRASSG